ncbi:hypothetical protein [Marinitenerispora sediminis]|uniref:hypothetical protein n=1 Tax=Marinitenerispora sediminis TaxID=1931232 RepID=UPI0011C0527E|nr:hypothetical protein [Marinitenerispora sediminis]
MVMIVGRDTRNDNTSDILFFHGTNRIQMRPRFSGLQITEVPVEEIEQTFGDDLSNHPRRETGLVLHTAKYTGYILAQRPRVVQIRDGSSIDNALNLEQLHDTHSDQELFS